MRFLFGEDFFITYGRADAEAYAAALANRLIAAGYGCYLDQWQPIIDPQIPPPIRRALLRASTQVIVGSRAAADSIAVATEVALFAKTGRPIVPIDVDRALDQAQWVHSILGLARSSESTAALETSTPGDKIVDRLVNTFEFRRRSTRVRASLGAFAVVSCLLAGSSLLSARSANLQRLAAVAATATAQRQAQAARQATSAADDERLKKEAATRQFIAAADRASANARRADDQASSAEARGRLADSRAMAITSRTGQLTPDQRLLLAVQSWQRDANDDARGALQSALAEAGDLNLVLYSPDPVRTREVIGAGLRADGLLALAGYADGSLVTWSLNGNSTGSPTWQPSTNPSQTTATAAAFSPDARWAAIGYASGQVDIVQIENGRIGQRQNLPVFSPTTSSSQRLRPFVSTLAFSPDGSTLVAGWSDGRLQSFVPRTRSAGAVFGDPFDSNGDYHRLGVLALAFSHDGTSLASAHGGSRVRIWKASADFASTQSFSTDGDVSGLAFADESELIYATGQNGLLHARRVDNDAEPTTLLQPNGIATGSWTKIAPMFGGHEVAVQPLTHAMGLLSLTDKNVDSAFSDARTRLQTEATTLATAAQAPRAIAGLRDGTLFVFEARRGAMWRQLDVVPMIRRIAFDATGKTLFGLGESITTWNASDGVQLSSRRGAWDGVHSQILSATSSAGGVVVDTADLQRWQCNLQSCTLSALASEAVARPARAPNVNVWQDSESGGAWHVTSGSRHVLCTARRCMLIEPSSELLHAARRFALSERGEDWALSTDREVWLCRARHCTLVPALESGGDGWIGNVSFTPAGDELVIGTSEGRLRFFRTATGKEASPPQTRHSAAVTRISFDAEGRHMVSGGRDGTVVLWDVSAHRPIGEPIPRIANDQVVDLALAPSGEQAAVLYSGGIVRIYELGPNLLVRRACQVAGRSLTSSEWQLFVGSPACTVTCGNAKSRCLAQDARAATQR